MNNKFFIAILCGMNFGLWQESFNAFSFMTVLLIFIIVLCEKENI